MSEEPEPVSGPQFRHVEDLAGVVGEVLGHVKNRAKHRGPVTLDEPRLAQATPVELRKNAVGLGNRAREILEQNRLLRRFPGGELGRAVAQIGRPSDAVNDPLANVAGQMEKEVADAV